MSIESNKLDNIHTETTVLDKPCKFCKVLELDDALYGGEIKNNGNRETFVDFGEVAETKQDRITNSGWRVAMAIKAMSFLRPNNDVDAPRTVAKTELRLSYPRRDRLPDLQAIGDTASTGCVFCKVLRSDLRAAWETTEAKWGDEREEEKDRDDESEEQSTMEHEAEDMNADLEDEDDQQEFKKKGNEEFAKDAQFANTEAQTSKADLVITEMIYKLREYGAGDDRPQRTWLDALYVFFTIQYQGKKRNYIFDDAASSKANIALDLCTSWLQIRGQPFMSDPLSPVSLRRMNELIQLSEKEQPVKVVKNPFLPTRLLDVQASCPSGLRLVITETDPDVYTLDASQRRYAALSYCWGSGDAALKQLKTTKDVLQKHLSEVPMDKVPQTVVDSIRVCRALGLQYFWVDALCILQGDREDWSKESFQMSNIYENSYLTLCVVQGDSCSSGFLRKDHNPPNVRVKFQSKLDSSISGNITLRMLHPPPTTLRRCTKEFGKYSRIDDEPGNSDLESASWGTRGWTFQEDQLAPRKVFFGNLMFHVSRGSKLEAADSSTVEHSRFIDTMGSLEQGLETWYSMITDYSKRVLSFEQDKFPAIAALARHFSERFEGQRYMAGLWESDIHKGLLWTSTSEWKEFDEYQRLVPKEYTAPSWSWARRPLRLDWVLIGDENPKSELIVRGSDVVTEEHNKFGRISKGRLLLTARKFKPTTRRNGKIGIKHSDALWKFMNSRPFNYMLQSKNNEYMAKIRFDWDSQSSLNDDGYPRGPMNDISLILTASIFPGNDWMLKSDDLADDQELLLGIVVIPSTEEHGAYEKIGLFFTEDRGEGGRKFWKDIPMQDLVLV
ncbi:unnamed protein product [Fusarium graminearum]|nr:unnamed protein product [Fusarium graminearum]